MKKWFSVALLALCSMAVLSAKSYQFVLTGPVKVGTVKLRAGQYSVKVEGSNAVFTDSNANTFTTPVKVENVDKKFGDTRVQSVKDGGEDRISEIDLGGSKTKLGF